MSALDQKVRQGYKQSEVGIIPDEWDVLLMDEVTDSLSSGATPFRGNSSFYKGSNRWITSGELKYGVINNTIEKISDEAIKKANLKVHPSGTFLMAITGLEAAGTRGSCGIVGKPSTTNQSCMAVYPNKKLTSNYLFHWYVYNGDELAFKYCQGTKQLSYTAGLLKTIPVLVPRDTTEQTAIANALSDVDALLTELEKLIAKKQAIKTATMQQLLTGKTRLPQFATYTEGEKKGQPKGTKPSELGEIPEDWDVLLMDEVTDSLSSGATPFRGNPSFYKGNNRWITSGELKYGVINDTIEKISDEAIKKANLKVHQPGTFLMAITGLEAAGTRGSCGIVGTPATTNQSCMAIYPNKKLKSSYLFHWYVYNGEELALKYCQGTKQLSYTAGLLKTIPVLVPRNADEQTAISSIPSDMNNEIQTIEQRLAKTRQIKQGMMQELLTGRTRLPFEKES
ncbi:restriction endonuclease subunit S [Vibrio sp. B172a]|uniref:restriction endonuclease subunit S n=1 Tax=Vibrio sp. B172a TaxID=2835790 RepID=UPI002553050C|nr:restriction endonuclease subunit S [Vibrio sp. B172a]MDK9783400.1 restriction endonuclease subunit S [Vibrio sp. B172a]